MMKPLLTALMSVGVGLALVTGVARAATEIVVTPGNTQGWASADTRPGGAINYVVDPTSPYPDGALQLTTDNTNEAKAQYLHESTVATLGEVETLGYSTKYVAGPPHAAASYQLVVDLNGVDTAGGFTTLVYEPYWNGTVDLTGEWQDWDVDTGNMWSSSTFSEGTCAVVSGAGGPPFYTLAGLQTACPEAEVLAFGVNVGSYNPGYDVLVDGVEFNDDVYNFEVTEPGPVVNEPTSKDDCKKGGWMTLTDAYGEAFPNQGQCVSYFNQMN